MRKYQHTLHICGMMVIIFGLWSVAKTVLCLVFSDQVREVLFGEYPDLIQRVILYIIMAVFVGIDFLIRLYVGMSAMAEAGGRKKRFFYIIVAFIIFVLSVISFCTVVYSSIYDESYYLSKLDVIISGVVELTCAYNLFELLYNSIRLRRLKKE